MELDLVEKKTLFFATIISFFVFIFLPLEFAMKIFIVSLTVYSLVLFFLCTYWANEWHPERKFIIGLLVTIFHAFIFSASGLLGFILAQFTLKFSPFLIDYFREVLIWR
jgi:hypothetical protein